jgi:hypothetical protein
VAKSKTSPVIKLVEWRGSFLQLDKAKSFKPGQDPRFEATFLGDPTREDHAKQIAEINFNAIELIKAQWGEEFLAIVRDKKKKGEPTGLEMCFGLADLHPKKSKYDGYKGQFYIVTANSDRPTVVSRGLEPVVPGNKQWPYSGAYVNTNVTLWCQDNWFGKAIRANLRIVQFNKDGTPFGAGQADANKEFTALGDLPASGGG